MVERSIPLSGLRVEVGEQGVGVIEFRPQKDRLLQGGQRLDAANTSERRQDGLPTLLARPRGEAKISLAQQQERAGVIGIGRQGATSGAHGEQQRLGHVALKPCREPDGDLFRNQPRQGVGGTDGFATRCGAGQSGGLGQQPSPCQVRSHLLRSEVKIDQVQSRLFAIGGAAHAAAVERLPPRRRLRSARGCRRRATIRLRIIRRPPKLGGLPGRSRLLTADEQGCAAFHGQQLPLGPSAEQTAVGRAGLLPVGVMHEDSIDLMGI